MTTYLAKFNDEGRRIATYIKDDMDEAKQKELIAEGFVEIDSDTFNLLLGNVDGQEHIRDPKTGDCSQVYVPTYTPEQIAQQNTAKMGGMTKQLLDSTAKEYSYDDCLTACSYVDTGVSQYDKEGAAFRAWRSQVWEASYAILNDVLDGKRELPDYETLVSELPAFSL